MAEVVIIGSGVVGSSTGEGFAAAFSVAFKGSARPFLAENRVAGNPAKERVRVEGHPSRSGERAGGSLYPLD